MKIVAIDTETHLIGQANPLPRVVCVTAYDGESSEIFRVDDPRVSDLLRADRVIGWNLASFDLPVIWRHGTPETRAAVWDLLCSDRLYDGMLAHRIFKHAKGIQANYMTSLKDFCEKYLKIHVEKEDTWRLRYAILDGVPFDQWPEDALSYALEDAVLHWQACHWQESHGYCGESFTRGKSVVTMAHDCRKAFALALTAAPGIRTDPEKIEALEEVDKARLAELSATCKSGGIMRATGTIDNKALQALAAKAERDSDVKFSRTEKTGAIQLDPGKVLLTENPVLIAHKELVSTRKRVGDGWTKGLYAELRAGNTFVNRCKYDPIKVTGRTGSSGAKIGRDNKAPLWGGNHQNLPRSGGVRECHIPRPGRWFLAIDFSALELHTLAQCCINIVRYSKLAEALNKNLDAHSVTGAQFLGVSYDEFKTHPKKKHYRTLAKPFNFGIAGGMGEARFREHAASAYGVRLSQAEFWKYKEKYFQLYPEIREYMQIQGNLTEITVPVTGRKRGGVGYCDACNGPFQSLGSDVATRALFACVMHCYREKGRLKGAIPVAFIHDEILFEVPADPDIADRLAKAACDIMVTEGGKYLPHVPPKVEATIMPYWSKSFEPNIQNGKERK